MNYPIFNNAPQYLRFREGKGLLRFFKRFFESRSLNLALKGIKDIYSVCDCPSGPGRLFEFWKKKKFKIIAVDLSPDMIQASKTELQRLKTPGNVVSQDAFKLHKSQIPPTDLLASVRFVYYFDKSQRLELLLSSFSNKYLLLQYKTSQTLAGKKCR